MKTVTIGDATLYCGTMEETVGGIDRVDCIFTDPPYLYLKQDFDRPWDEALFFDNVKRLLPPKGFIAMFGRGTSFYRWNTRLADLGFKFKEEIIWDKRHSTTPMTAIGRIHETVSVFTKKTGVIKKSKRPYIERRRYDISAIANDIRFIKNAIGLEREFFCIMRYLHTGKASYGSPRRLKHKATLGESNRVFCGLNAVTGIKEGMRETDIVSVTPPHNNAVHPTEKPILLAERILALISDPGDVVYDPFMGSGSFGVAAINTGRKFIGSEMNPEYFDIARKRIREAMRQPSMFHAA